MEYIIAIIWGIVMLTSMCMLYYYSRKKKKVDNGTHKNEIEYTIKKEYDARYDNYNFFIMEGYKCIGCCDTLGEAKKVLERAMSNKKSEIVYSTNNKSNESLTN